MQVRLCWSKRHVWQFHQCSRTFLSRKILWPSSLTNWASIFLSANSLDGHSGFALDRHLYYEMRRHTHPTFCSWWKCLVTDQTKTDKLLFQLFSISFNKVSISKHDYFLMIHTVWWVSNEIRDSELSNYPCFAQQCLSDVHIRIISNLSSWIKRERNRRGKRETREKKKREQRREDQKDEKESAMQHRMKIC